MFVNFGFRDELMKCSLLLRDKLSNCLIRAPKTFQSLKAPDNFLKYYVRK